MLTSHLLTSRARASNAHRAMHNMARICARITLGSCSHTHAALRARGASAGAPRVRQHRVALTRLLRATAAIFGAWQRQPRAQARAAHLRAYQHNVSCLLPGSRLAALRALRFINARSSSALAAARTIRLRSVGLLNIATATHLLLPAHFTGGTDLARMHALACTPHLTHPLPYTHCRTHTLPPPPSPLPPHHTHCHTYTLHTTHTCHTPHILRTHRHRRRTATLPAPHALPSGLRTAPTAPLRAHARSRRAHATYLFPPPSYCTTAC